MTTTTTRTYAARCEGCGAPAVGTLASNQGVPIYACGSWGSRRHGSAHPGLTLAPDAVANVTPATDDELRDLAALVTAHDATPAAFCPCWGCTWRRTSGR